MKPRADPADEALALFLLANSPDDADALLDLLTESRRASVTSRLRLWKSSDAASRRGALLTGFYRAPTLEASVREAMKVSPPSWKKVIGACAGVMTRADARSRQPEALAVALAHRFVAQLRSPSAASDAAVLGPGRNARLRGVDAGA